jgi:hypothetical protein
MSTVVKTTKKQRGGVTGKGFMPGKSGNPKGRPLGSFSIMSRIKQHFEENPEKFDTYVQEILNDPKMRKVILEQIEGKPKERIEMKGVLDFGDLDLLSTEELMALRESNK